MKTYRERYEDAERDLETNPGIRYTANYIADLQVENDTLRLELETGQKVKAAQKEHIEQLKTAHLDASKHATLETTIRNQQADISTLGHENADLTNTVKYRDNHIADLERRMKIQNGRTEKAQTKVDQLINIIDNIHLQIDTDWRD